MKDFKKKLAFVSFGVIYWIVAGAAILVLTNVVGDAFGFPRAAASFIFSFSLCAAGWIKIDQKVWDWKVE